MNVIGTHSNIGKEILVKSLEAVVSYDPFVTFSKETYGEYNYCVRILVFIPSHLGENFQVLGPDTKKTIPTRMGNINTRTITIKWTQPVDPSSLPHDLWTITVWYSPLDASKEDVIRVVYEYGDPKTSRGTITTSGDPSGINPDHPLLHKVL